VADRMGLAAPFYPVTVAGPRRFFTGLPLTTGPYVGQQFIPRNGGRLPRALLDLALELLDNLGHGLAHAGEFPVLDLDHAQA
jgi:hypothetical protein